MVGIKLHGEANDMDDEERTKLMVVWKRDKFPPKIEKHEIPKSRIPLLTKPMYLNREYLYTDNSNYLVRRIPGTSLR